MQEPTSSVSIPAFYFSTLLYIIDRPSWRSFFIFSLDELKEWYKL